MSYTISEKLFVASLGVLFCLVIVAMVALIMLGSYWIRNQQNKLSREHKRDQDRIIARADQDRQQWSALLAERDKQIDRLLDQIAQLSQNLDRAKVLLGKSEELRQARLNAER